MKAKIESKSVAKIRLSLRNASTDRRVWRGKWENNLAFDNLLVNLAGQNPLGSNPGYGGCFMTCKVGSGTTPNSYNTANTAVFTQTGTTVTCTGLTFFTSAMVGGLLKYGGTGVSSGAEQYIASVNVGAQTCVVSGVGMTQATPVAGTVYQVQQTALTNYSYQSSAYASTGNGTTFASNVMTLSRTFVFAVQGSSYSVNEIGYHPSASVNGNVFGRVVLGSSVVVSPAFYLVAEIQISVTQSPGSPTSVGNVGTGIDTSGTAMSQGWSCRIVNSDGSLGYAPAVGASPVSDSGGAMDSSAPVIAFHAANDITLGASITTPCPAAVEGYHFSSGNYSNSGQPVGVGVSTCTISTSVSAFTCYFLIIGRGYTATGYRVSQAFVIQLATPFAVPAGSFSGSATITWQFSRALVN